MSEGVKRLVESCARKAHSKLEDAERDLAAGSYDSAVSHAYYAMFNAAKACLARVGSFPRSHGGLASEFGRRIVREGKVGRRLGRDLAKMREMRVVADYGTREITKGEAEKALKVAASFLVESERLLRTPP